jgi:hypothetical protein
VLLLLDQAGESLLDVPAAGVEPLDLLEDGHRLRRESLDGELVGQGEEEGDGLGGLAGQDQHVRELLAERRARSPLLQLGAQDLDGSAVVPGRDEGDDVLVLRPSEAQCHAPSLRRQRLKVRSRPVNRGSGRKRGSRPGPPV